MLKSDYLSFGYSCIGLVFVVPAIGEIKPYILGEVYISVASGFICREIGCSDNFIEIVGDIR
jgi:hypothetical protein